MSTTTTPAPDRFAQNRPPMSTATAPVLRSSTYRPASSVGFGRLVAAEFRKLVDTRAGFWLIIATVVSTILVATVNAIFMSIAFTADGPMKGSKLSWIVTTQSSSTMITLFATVLSILTITSEWGQRTVLTTFVLEPRRGRVLGAKLVVILVVALVAASLAFPIAAGLMPIAHAITGVELDWSLKAGAVLGFYLMTLLGAAMGVGFGLAMLNTPAAIVTYFLLPSLVAMTSLISMAWKDYAKINPWVNPTAAQDPLLSGNITGEAWAHIATSSLIWIGIPIAIGIYRWMRREAK